MTAVTMSPDAARLMLDSGTGWITVDEVPQVECPRCKGRGSVLEHITETPGPEWWECQQCKGTGTVSIVGQRVEVMTASTREFSASLTERTAATALVADPLPISDDPDRNDAYVMVGVGGEDGVTLTVYPANWWYLPQPPWTETDITPWLPHADWTPGRTALRLTEVTTPS